MKDGKHKRQSRTEWPISYSVGVLVKWGKEQEQWLSDAKKEEVLNKNEWFLNPRLR